MITERNKTYKPSSVIALTYWLERLWHSREKLKQSPKESLSWGDRREVRKNKAAKLESLGQTTGRGQGYTGRCLGICSELPSSIQQNTDRCMSVRKLQDTWGKNKLERLKWTVPVARTWLGRVPILTRNTRKTTNSWGTGKSTPKGFALVAGSSISPGVKSALVLPDKS